MRIGQVVARRVRVRAVGAMLPEDEKVLGEIMYVTLVGGLSQVVWWSGGGRGTGRGACRVVGMRKKSQRPLVLL